MKKNKSQIDEKNILCPDDEPTIDGKKLSEVFSDAKTEPQIKSKKENNEASKSFVLDYNPDEEKKIKKKKSITKKILSAISWVLIVAVGGAAGYVLGDVVIGKLDTYDPSAYAGLAESEEQIELWKTKNISSLTATQVFVVAEHNLNNCTYFSMTTRGYDGEEKGIVSNSFAPQSICGYRYVNGDEAYFTYFSEGIMPVFKRTEFVPNGDTYYLFKGSKKDGAMVWEEEIGKSGTNQYSKDDYITLVGCDANRPIDYTVSTKTVTAQSEMQREGDFYRYSITLSAKKSVSNYVKKMKYMSGLGDYPVFKSVTLDFVVDANMNFQTIGIVEKYNVNYGMIVGCEGRFRCDFDYTDIQKL